jgi:tetratricopeptide (TPR) repeat protein
VFKIILSLNKHDGVVNGSASYLLVFDDVQDFKKIRHFLPNNVRGRPSVLITSTNEIYDHDGYISKILHTPPFDQEESTTFLLHLLRDYDEDTEALKHISKMFDGLPLGLKAAGEYMSSNHCNCSEFLELQPFTHDSIKNLHIMWSMTVSKLTPDEARLLQCLTLLDADCIPVDLLESKIISKFYSSYEDKRVMIQARGRLSVCCLINFTKDNSAIFMYKCLQRKLFTDLKADKLSYAISLEIVLNLLLFKGSDPDITQIRNPQTWPEREKYVNHVRYLRKNCNDALSANLAELYCNLLYRYAYWYYETGQYRHGLIAIDEALRAASLSSQMDAKLLSLMHFTKGQIFNECNQPHKSLHSFKNAVRYFEPLYTMVDKWPTTYMSRLHSQLGNSLTGSGRFDEAQEHHKRAIEIAESSGGFTRRQLGILYANLGSCFLWKGDLDRAQSLLEMACMKYDRMLDCNSYALGNVYLMQGKVEDAIGKHYEALDMFAKGLGVTHHFTADSYHKIGSILALEWYEGKNLVEAV